LFELKGKHFLFRKTKIAELLAIFLVSQNNLLKSGSDRRNNL
jgi:hypothetical protein